jgi:hypothetical protein
MGTTPKKRTVRSVGAAAASAVVATSSTGVAVLAEATWLDLEDCAFAFEDIFLFCLIVKLW